jgi:RNA polymerase sigma-70 factor (ECF subfamily)
VRHERRSPIESACSPDQLDVIDEGKSVPELASIQERIEILSDALITLPPRCREVVMLYKLRNLSRSEVARRLDVSEKTVDEQVARGVKRLAKYFRVRNLDRQFGL